MFTIDGPRTDVSVAPPRRRRRSAHSGDAGPAFRFKPGHHSGPCRAGVKRVIDTTFTYDNAGNVGTQTDARSTTTTYTYDVLNRVTAATGNGRHGHV